MIENRRIFMVGMMVSVIFVIMGCVWLSLSAETLDEVAEHFGASESPVWAPPIPDYEIPGLEGNMMTAIVVGIAFSLLTLGVTLVAGKALRSKT